jgi:hypothetical protein
MRLILLTAAALLAVPTIALAQGMGMGADQPMSPSSGSYSGSYRAGASAAPTAPSTGAAASLAAGLPVKDKTGMTIGSVTDVKTDASGKKVAMIKMGADNFAVDASALAVENGAATINATRSEISTMLGKAK